MNLKDLITNWEKTATSPLTDTEFSVRLAAKDAAKIAALAEMYPSRSREQIITELLTAALTELEYTLPYIKGEHISSLDELGDPIYEDVGPTSTFSELTRKHLEKTQQH